MWFRGPRNPRLNKHTDTPLRVTRGVCLRSPSLFILYLYSILAGYVAVVGVAGLASWAGGTAGASKAFVLRHQGRRLGAGSAGTNGRVLPAAAARWLLPDLVSDPGAGLQRFDLASSDERRAQGNQ
ncbi:hypothetical protein NDU88_002545 [Pleurodeles waltl]|uniref:Uncharacterized protein n=1 Tax=Pleurodeles waltl TaxID=8319 RepID=A0AAV7SAT7_PLEWA|nr:hypothetical protein NDU88_002545 [Pleurodeles waltl]